MRRLAFLPLVALILALPAPAHAAPAPAAPAAHRTSTNCTGWSPSICLNIYGSGTSVDRWKISAGYRLCNFSGKIWATYHGTYVYGPKNVPGNGGCSGPPAWVNSDPPGSIAFASGTVACGEMLVNDKQYGGIPCGTIHS